MADLETWQCSIRGQQATFAYVHISEVLARSASVTAVRRKVLDVEAT